MVSPLVAWAIVIIAFSITGLMFLASEPIIATVYSSLFGMVPDEGVPTMNMLKMLYYAIPVGVNVLLFIWAFLVTTRRQPVISRMY